MKAIKFLFFTALFVCVVGIIQTHAQALVDNYIGYLVVTYVAEDGTPVTIGIEGDVHGVITPSGNMKYEFHGTIPEGVPLPGSAVMYDDGPYFILITPSGEVNSTFTIKKTKD